MKLKLITEAADLKSMMDRYDNKAFSNFSLLLDFFAPKNAKQIIAETARAVVDGDLRKDQRYWERLQRGLIEEGKNQLSGAAFKEALSQAFNISAPKQAAPGATATQNATAPAQGGATLGGLLKGAAQLYVGAFARQHGLSMPGENKIPQNVRILSTFTKAIGEKYPAIRIKK